MKERGIIFNSEMVQAILDGRKTVTRRPVKPEVPNGWNWHGWVISSTDRKIEGKATWAKEPTESVITHGLHAVKCPFGKIGDRLYVRETVKYGWSSRDKQSFAMDYKADGFVRKEWLRVPTFEEWETRVKKATQYLEDNNLNETWEKGMSPFPWIPSIHMPKWATRIWLEITDIRVERVQDIERDPEEAIKEGVPIYEQDYDYGFDNGKGSMAVNNFRYIWDSIYNNWSENPWVWVIEFKRIDK